MGAKKKRPSLDNKPEEEKKIKLSTDEFKNAKTECEDDMMGSLLRSGGSKDDYDKLVEQNAKLLGYDISTSQNNKDENKDENNNNDDLGNDLILDIDELR